jgi:superfamily II DNA or RNA helicase
MQSATTLYGVPFKQNPRVGQATVFKEIYENRPRKLNIKLPTGYGKTITAVGAYSILRNLGIVNRLLFVFPTDAQLEQFVNDGPGDMMSVGISEQLSIVDIRYYGVNAIRKNSANEAQVFAITVQALSQPSGRDIVNELLSKCLWMVVVDEYHHYGIEAAWGKSVLSLPYDHLLAMSATPSRKANDSAFGNPDIVVKYRQAVEERAVKPLVAHSYNYRLDAVVDNGEVVSFTTDELIEAAGGSSPEKIEKFKVSRKMRWSPKYVSPLVAIPIERMLRERISTGYPLQAIVGAMCVSHAELVCKQISDMFPELRIDWVGTGTDGRSGEENSAALSAFCPKKDHNGNRNPTLDVLVHVGMAGEGLDSIYVSEVIHLNKASWNNSNDQENGRGARYLGGVVCHINFDSGSEYAKYGYVGDAIMDAMDNDPPSPEDSDPRDRSGEMPELPEEPTIQLLNVYLESIDSGELKKMKAVAIEANVTGIDYQSLDADFSNPEWKKIEGLWRGMRAREAQAHNEQATIKQWREAVNGAVSAVTGRVVRSATGNGMRFEKSFPGDVKKRINRMKKLRCGELTEDVDVCKAHYKFIKDLEVEIIASGVPSWLQ